MEVLLEVLLEIPLDIIGRFRHKDLHAIEESKLYAEGFGADPALGRDLERGKKHQEGEKQSVTGLVWSNGVQIF